jgi:DNA-binding CsgD family transcriptional regulator
MHLAAVVDVIESAYDFEQPDQAWLTRIVGAAVPLVDRGLGVAAYLYDARDPSGVKVLHAALPEQVDPALFRTFVSMTPRVAWARPFEIASSSPAFVSNVAQALHGMFGARDIVAINGLDASGFGLWLGAIVPERETCSKKQARMFERIAPHLASAVRLRRRLSRQPEAILDPNGHVHDASGDAKLEGARAVLRKAVKAVETARGKQRREDPERAVAEWKGLVAAQWTLVDRFESDGKRFIVAERNEVTERNEPGAVASLSPREHAVISAVAAGHHDKLVAYELGLAPSTVRVLVLRAVRKLGRRARMQSSAISQLRSHGSSSP